MQSHKHKHKNFRNALIILSFSFALLTFFAKQYPYFKFDLPITLFIQSIYFSGFDQLMRYITLLGNFGSVAVVVILFSILGYYKKGRLTPLLLLASTFGGLLISLFFKILVGRPRPDPLLVHQIGSYLNLDSFPSGHVLGAVSLYGFLLYLAYTKLQLSLFRSLVIGFCTLMIMLMGVSRIYLGAHWFSDVLGAYLIGFVWLSAVVFIYHKLHPKVGPVN